MIPHTATLVGVAAALFAGNDASPAWPSNPDKLTVHLVPHTHDDLGWLKTVDEYFSGNNNTIWTGGDTGRGSVRNILDAVIMSLEQDASRKFTYVEMGFFVRWWRELSQKRKDKVKQLVASGQLSFANGGWVMHDEAATHYIDMVDQTALGHRYLKQEFNVTPTVGWQIDPFGHSVTQEALLSGEAGFDALFFGRIDYQDLELRRNEKRPEFIWQASPSLGSDSQVFAGLSGEYGGNYGPPKGFNWDSRKHAPDDPIEVDKELETYNAPERLAEFIASATQQASQTRGKHIMWTMGSDFNYQHAETWYTNMDKLIKVVNEDGRIHARYSNPMDYVAAKRAETDVTWPLKSTPQGDDFFPYASQPHHFWTGYFTSRPALKGYIRDLSSFHQAARQVQAVAGSKNFARVGAIPELLKLEQALGLGQHHDAVSGTSKQHVAFDYAKQLSIGEQQGEDVFFAGLTVLAGDEGNWFRCRRLNETVCSPSHASPTTTIRIWNSLAQAREELISIPVGQMNVMVNNSLGEAVAIQVMPIPETISQYHRNTGESKYVAMFKAHIPAIGFETFTLTQVELPTALPTKAVENDPTLTEIGSADIVIENEVLSMTFSANTGRLTTIQNKQTHTKIDAEQHFCFYTSNEGDKQSKQVSGEYTFRPDGSQVCTPVSVSKTNISVIRGAVSQEVHQTFALQSDSKTPWLTQICRLAQGERFASCEFTVGEIPLEVMGGSKALQSGKEIVSRFTTSIASASELLTDSNGRDMLVRTRNARPSWNFTQTEPVAGNYYPINTAVAIKDANAQLTILVDRAQGAGSISDGELEIMVHRRVLKSDSGGVYEPLNETQFVHPYASSLNSKNHGGDHYGPGLVIRSKHLITLEPPESATSVWRPLADRVFAKPVVSLLDQGSAHLRPLSSLAKDLPANVQIMTLQALSEGVLMLRLSHQFGIGEDPQLSRVASIDLAQIFHPQVLSITHAREVSLTNNQEKSEILAKRRSNLQWKTGYKSAPHPWRDAVFEFTKNSTVLLGPLEIKTFILELETSSSTISI